MRNLLVYNPEPPLPWLVSATDSQRRGSGAGYGMVGRTLCLPLWRARCLCIGPAKDAADAELWIESWVGLFLTDEGLFRAFGAAASTSELPLHRPRCGYADS